jgi:PKD repeat protein
MKRFLQIWLTAILYSGILSAQTLMPLPPHVSAFPGNVRGYWFTAPTCFTITGLEVPTEASSGAQNIAVVRLNNPPPTFSTTTNDFTLLFLTQNDPATGVVPVNIPVSQGDIIGILGNRADNNSYAASPASSTINGLPVTLSRLGMQFLLSTTVPQELWTEAGSSISRINMYYDANFTFNLNYTWQGGTTYAFTNGSGVSSTSIWDYGDGSPLDTAFNPTHTYASPGNYTVCSTIYAPCDTDTVCNTVIICPAPALADYTYSTTYPTVAFTDASTNAVSYSWDFGDGNTSAQASPSHTYAGLGLYNVCLSVTDSCGGINTKCVPISVCPSLIPVSLGNDITACGTATVLLPGFSTYNWSTGATTASIQVTSSGDYTVVATNSAGCSGADTVNVTINPLPTVSLGSNITQCGGPVALSAAGNGISYQWNTFATTQSINVIATGIYSVTVTDGLGCTNQASVSVSILTPPTANLGNDLNICQGFVSISASGGSSYTWSTGATTAFILVNSSGTYWVEVIAANGCSASDTINIVMNAPAVSYVEVQSQICLNAASITLTPGTPAGGFYTGPGVSGTTFNPTIAGLGQKNIVYNYTDSAGCIGRDTSSITVDPCSGLAEWEQLGFMIYPNPSSGIFQLKSRQMPELIRVMDLQGREMLSFVPSSAETILDLSSLASGNYIVRILTDGRFLHHPVLKK